MCTHTVVLAFLLFASAAALRHEIVQTHGHCLQHVWKQKLRKHAELVNVRAQSISASTERYRTPQTAYDAFEPTYTCHSEWRTGATFGDGGKFVCGEPDYFRSRGCLAYSVGSDGDPSFEADVIKRFGCEVHTFDPTGDSAKFDDIIAKTGGHFHPWGVGKSGTKIHNEVTGHDNELMSLYDITQRLGHAGRHIDILKIDCEGCEWDAFSALWPRIIDGSVHIGQIQVELHFYDFDKIHAFFTGAEEAGYMIFHKERNQWGCDGYRCVEYALIHVSDAHRLFQAMHCK